MERLDRRPTGFTIIELVVVIVILGILAAVALPKFADIRDDAHNAKHSGSGGAFGAAVNITHSKWLAAGGTGSTVTLEDGTSVGVGAEGWPPDPAGAVVTAAECVTAWNSVLQPGSPQAATDTSRTYQATVAGGDCVYTYVPDSTPARTISYDVASGAVSITP